METQQEIPKSKLNISEDVVSTIAGVAAMECFGVVGMSTRNLKEGITELLRKDNVHKGIDISILENKVTVTLFIVVAYGVKISEVAQNIQEKVKFSIENMTGMEVESVNVNVTGVRPDSEEQGGSRNL
jgi:uncharacterized alkaline shock family protein YloU